MKIVQNILKIAKEYKVNNQQLCKILNTNSSKIYDWKVGKSRPSAEDICILANYFNVSTDYLLGRTNEDTKITGSTIVAEKIKDTNIQSDIIEDTSIMDINIENTNIGSTYRKNNTEQAITENEAELLKVYRSLNLRDKTKLMNFVFDMEDKATKA